MCHMILVELAFVDRSVALLHSVHTIHTKLYTQVDIVWRAAIALQRSSTSHVLLHLSTADRPIFIPQPTAASTPCAPA